MDDIYSLDGPRFMRLAWRVAAYGGVLTARLREESSKQSDEETADFAAVALNHPDLFDRRRV